MTLGNVMAISPCLSIKTQNDSSTLTIGDADPARTRDHRSSGSRSIEQGNRTGAGAERWDREDPHPQYPAKVARKESERPHQLDRGSHLLIRGDVRLAQMPMSVDFIRGTKKAVIRRLQAQIAEQQTLKWRR